MSVAKEFALAAELIREKSKAKEVKTLTFSSRPITFREVKEEIEGLFLIPTCVQTLRYEDGVVADSTKLETLYLQSGDTIQVFYPAKGATEVVKGAVDWLSKCSSCLKELNEAHAAGSTDTLSREYISTFMNGDAFTFLAEDMFMTEEDSIRDVNCKHFDYLGGIEVIVEFLKQMMETRSRNIRVGVLYLEAFEGLCCSALGRFCGIEELVGRVIKCGGLESIIKSFLSFPADDKSLSNNCTMVILEALRGIVNIVDFTGSRYLEVASERVIDQSLLVFNAPKFSSGPADRWVISFLLCLTRSQETHANLLKPDAIEKLLAWHEANKEDDQSETVATRSYIGVIMAQMIIPSRHLLLKFPTALQKRMLTFLNHASNDQALKIQEFEERKGSYWATFQSCLECLYEPLVPSEKKETHEEDSPSMVLSLHEFSITMLLQFLQNCLGRRVHVDVVIKESLLDYVIPLPWILPAQYGNRARNVVRQVAKFTRIQPPALVSLTKASIAINKCGLRKLNNVDSMSKLFNDLI